MIKTLCVMLLLLVLATAALAQPTPIPPIFGTPQAPPWAGATIVLETPLPFMATYTPTPTGEPDLPVPTIPIITIGELPTPPYFVIRPLPDWVVWIIRPLMKWSYR